MRIKAPAEIHRIAVLELPAAYSGVKTGQKELEKNQCNRQKQFRLLYSTLQIFHEIYREHQKNRAKNPEGAGRKPSISLQNIGIVCGRLKQRFSRKKIHAKHAAQQCENIDIPLFFENGKVSLFQDFLSLCKTPFCISIPLLLLPFRKVLIQIAFDHAIVQLPLFVRLSPEEIFKLF